MYLTKDYSSLLNLVQSLNDGILFLSPLTFLVMYATMVRMGRRMNLQSRMKTDRKRMPWPDARMVSRKART